MQRNITLNDNKQTAIYDIMDNLTKITFSKINQTSKNTYW